MEEGIKILETQIQACKECKFATCEQCEISYTEVKAIENLIARNKELEEKNNALKDYEIFLISHYDDNYIPKSKVKEKIEELRNEKYDDITFKYNKIEVNGIIEVILQELLED